MSEPLDGPAVDGPAAEGPLTAPVPLVDMVSGLGDALAGYLGDATVTLDGDGTPVVDVPRERWHEAGLVARDRLGLSFLDWLSAVDRPAAEPPGLEVVLHVASPRGLQRRDGVRRVPRLLLRTTVPDSDLHLRSLTDVWAGVAWHERETFEMFGLTFDAFDDRSDLPLRPLLLPDGFEGTPLRKSFVLAARAVKPWPGAKEPGESDTHAAPSRRKILPPGVPDPTTWGVAPDGT